MRYISNEILEALSLNPALTEYFLTDEGWSAFKLEMEPHLRGESLIDLIDCVAVFDGVKIKLLPPLPDCAKEA